MSRPAKFTPGLIESAQSRLRSAKTVAEFREAQSILWPALFRLSKAQTAEAIGLSPFPCGRTPSQVTQPFSRDQINPWRTKVPESDTRR